MLTNFVLMTQNGESRHDEDDKFKLSLLTNQNNSKYRNKQNFKLTKLHSNIYENQQEQKHRQNRSKQR